MLYYITDRAQFPGNEAERRRRLVARVSEAIGLGVDYVQVREKDLSSRDLEVVASQIVQLRTERKEPRTAVLINSRTDIAIATGAQGVHLRSDDVTVADVEAAFAHAGLDRPTIAVSCHTPDEVRRAADAGAGFVVFGPVFAKGESEVAGLGKLQQAAGLGIPVLALGGVTLDNAASCLAAGAAGVAGIRLFQAGTLSETVSALRSTGV